MPSLTTREQAIAGLIALHQSNKEIASQLGVSVATVKNHCHNVYTKLGVPGRRALQRERMLQLHADLDAIRAEVVELRDELIHVALLTVELKLEARDVRLN